MEPQAAQRQRAIFVTGAASGIGRATAVLFASRGWFVGACDLNRAALDTLEQELGAGFYRALDVTDRPALLAASISCSTTRASTRRVRSRRCRGRRSSRS